jgi:hypothetical protein
MKTLLTMVITLGMLWGVGNAQSTSKSQAESAQGNSSSNHPAEEAAVRKLYDDERQAFVRGDAKDLDTYFAPEFIVTNPFNRLITQKKYFVDMVANGTLAMKEYTRTIEYMHFYGDMVVVAGREHVLWGGKMPAAGKTSELRFTGVARKVNGKWIEVARHANIIVPMPEPPPPAAAKDPQ